MGGTTVDPNDLNDTRQMFYQPESMAKADEQNMVVQALQRWKAKRWEKLAADLDLTKKA